MNSLKDILTVAFWIVMAAGAIIRFYYNINYCDMKSCKRRVRDEG